MQVGDTIGDYEIIGVLGLGGMGKVFKVRNLISDRIEALKVLLPDLRENPTLADRFVREIKVHASLVHPNIASMYTAVRIDNQLCMIIEMIEGVTLEDKIAAGPLDPIEGLDYLCQMLSALSYAHERGVIHRDIKPANIMVGEGTDIKIGDFGAAYLQHGESTQTLRLGTPSYMSPEQVDESPLTHLSDMYCLGIVFYELLTGLRPFVARTLPALFKKILHDDPVPPSRLQPGVPVALDPVLMRALAKKPQDRYASWAEFALELASIGRLRSSQQAVPDSEKFEALKRVNMLSSLSEPELWALVKAGQWSRAPANQVIIGEGEQSDRLYFLAKGEAKVTKKGRLLNLIHAGEFFGEMSFIANGGLARQATVESAGDLLLATFERAALEQVQARCQLRFLWALLHNVVDRLVLADARLAQTN